MKNVVKGLKNVEENLFLSLKNESDCIAFSKLFLLLLTKNLPYAKGGLKLILNSQRELTLEESFGFSVDYEIWNSKVGEQRLNEKVMINGKYEQIPDLHLHPDTEPFKEIYNREGVRAFLVIPIQTAWENVGVLNLYHSEPGHFPEELITSLQRLLRRFGTISSLLWMRDEESRKREIFQKKSDGLQNFRSFYELIIENIPVGVVATNKSGYVVLMNQGMEKMSGQKKENVLGRKWYEAFGFSEETRKRLENSYWTGKVNYFPEIYITLGDGKVVPSEMKTALIRSEKNEVAGVVAICSDLTEKKRIEKEFERIERLSKLGQVATGVAHEIRNPLTGINSVLQLLKGKLTEDEEAQYLLEKTFGEVTRLNHFLENLLSFSSGKKLTFERVRIEELCEDVLLFVKKPLATNNITLIKRYGENLPPIHVDKPSIMQVLFNILLNATKAMPKEGKIILRTSLVNTLSKMSKKIFWHGEYVTQLLKERMNFPYVCITVRDEGIGINFSEMTRIFDPFYSASDGVGLGLYISSKIAENHQGLIGVESQPKKGATFYLLLPAVH
jgi:PAS domain S-box-containing protein